LFNSRRLIRPAGRVSVLAALAAAGLIASSGAAGAATASGPIISSVPIWAAADSGQSTASETYSCDLLALGQGLGGLNIDATLSAPAIGSEGEAATIALTTHVAVFPSALSRLLPGLVSVTVAGTARVGSESGEGVALAGHSHLAAGIAAESPAVMAVGKLALTAADTATVYVPPTITVTLNAVDNVLMSLTCHASSATVKIKVTAPAPGGPVYRCGSMDVPLPLAIGVTGPRVTGSTDIVTLSSPTNGLGAPYLPGTSSLAFSGGLPVTGALPGSILLSKHTTALTDKTFSVSDSLYLGKPGIYRILMPSEFTFTIFGPQKTQPVILSCALKTSPAPVGVTLTVTGKPATGGHGGTEANGAVPAGAPNTGGGSGPGSNLPMIAGGAALVLIGAGSVFAARRRRQGQPSS
jgi:hypothetical protein